MPFMVRKIREEEDDLNEIVRILHRMPISKLPIKFFKEDEAVKTITSLMKEKGTEYDIGNFLLCMDGDRLAGVIHSYDPMKIDQKVASKLYTKHCGLKFAAHYKEWRRRTKLCKNVGTSLYIHNAAYAHGYKDESMAEMLLDSLIESMNRTKYLFLYTDISMESKKKIEFLKAGGFLPERVVANEDDSPYVRMTLELRYHDVKNNIGGIDRSVYVPEVAL